MSTNTELLAALRAAHDAGDQAAAVKIAQQLAASPMTHETPPIPDDTLHVRPPDPADQPGGANWNRQFGATSGMSGPQKFAAGMGQAVVDTGRGLKQLGDQALDYVLPRQRNLSDLMTGQQLKSRYQEDQENIDAARQRDAELDKTGAGIAGNIAGNVAEFAVPGMGASAAATRLGLTGLKLGATTPAAMRLATRAYSVAKSAPAVGAGMGAISPVGSDETRLGNTGRGAVFGTLGAAAGKVGDSVLRTGEDALNAGARKAYEISQKYGVPLNLQQLASGKFMKYLNSITSEMPMSGAEDRAINQRQAFNNAMAGTGDIEQNNGLNMVDLENARQKVGGQIGAMADQHNAFITPQHIADINNIQAGLGSATPTVQGQVNHYIGRLFNNHVPINNPLPGGPIAQIPGRAWRENNTELTNHLNSLGEADGDLARRLDQLHDTYMDMMEAGMPPDQFDAFQNLRRQYANIKTMTPLVRKAPPGQGVDPKLLFNTVDTAGRSYMPNGEPTDLGELGQLGKQLPDKTPNSGTAYRHLLIGTGLGGIAGLGAHEAGNLYGNTSIEDPNHDILGGASIPAAMILAGLGNRAANSRLAMKYLAARAPQAVQTGMEHLTSVLPSAAVRAGQMPTDGFIPSDDNNMAEGGQPQKSTFWDLVKQGWKELTDADHGQPTAPPQNDGTQASGTVGTDFDRRIDQSVASQT